MAFVKSAFFLLCVSFLLLACNGRILDSKSVMINKVSDHQRPKTGSSLKTISMLIAGYPIASKKIIGHRFERRHENAEKVKSHFEERVLQERNDAAQEYDSGDSKDVQDVVVMDYAQPHRKPPIHNEEN